LAPHPTALFEDSGEMRKTSKSVLKNKLQVLCGMRNRQIPKVVILDGCALLWTVPWPASPAKVSAFIDAAVASITERMETTTILHVVFDRYYSLSTKSACRTARQKGLSRVYKLTEESPLPKQAMVMNVSANKMQVIQMIVDRLCLVQIPHGKRVVVTGPEPHPVQVGIGKWQTPITHEEADVIMAYHMMQEAEAGHSPISVVSDDTDVFLILVHHLHAHVNSLPHNIQVTMEGCSRSHAIIDVNKIVQQHNAVIPNLLGVHALSGCDTVSSFAGIGKATVFKRLMTFTDNLRLGDQSASLDEVTESCLRFVATLYGKEQETSLNSMRANIFKRKIAGQRHIPPKLSSLPPTIAAFKLHCQRAHFQTALWKAAGMSSPPNLDPLQHGWEMNGSELRPVFTPPGQLAAPDEVLNLIRCGCKTGCKTALCSCVKFTLTCSEFCKCMGQATCQNPIKAATPDSDDCCDEEPT